MVASTTRGRMLRGVGSTVGKCTPVIECCVLGVYAFTQLMCTLKLSCSWPTKTQFTRYSSASFQVKLLE